MQTLNSNLPGIQPGDFLKNYYGNRVENRKVKSLTKRKFKNGIRRTPLYYLENVQYGNNGDGDSTISRHRDIGFNNYHASPVVDSLHRELGAFCYPASTTCDICLLTLRSRGSLHGRLRSGPSTVLKNQKVYFGICNLFEIRPFLSLV